MKSKLLIYVLMLAVVFTFSAVPGFAATKQVVQVSEKVYVNGSDGESLNSSWKKEYKNGKLVKKTSFDYGESREETYKYNDKGKLKTVFIKYEGKKDGKEEYTYKKGKVSKITVYSYSKGDYKKAETVNYTYKSRKITQKTLPKDYSAFKYVSYYNKKGLKTKMEYYYGDNLINVWDYDYYQNGNIKKVVNKLDGEIIETSEYYKNGLLKKEVRQLYYGGKNVNTYEYDSNGLLKKKVNKYNKTTTTYKYKYSDFYGSTKKYPKTVKCYENGKLTSRTERRYKKISLADTSYIPERGYFRV